MTVIAASLPAATRSQSRLNGDFTSVMPAAAGDGADKVEHMHRRHGHGGRDETMVRDTQRSDGAQAWATLRIKVGETFAALAGTGATGSTSGTAPTDATTKDAGSQTSIELSLKIKTSGGGDAFQGAMKDFVQALYGALQAMFSPQGGANPPGSTPVKSPTDPIKVAPPGSSPVKSPSDPIKVAPPDVATVAPGEPDPTAAAPAATPEPGTVASAAASAPASTAAANPPASNTAPVSPSTATRSISVQMRLSYGGGLAGSLGSLVGQLASQQAAAGNTAAGGTKTDNGLAASFQRLLDASPAAASGTTLAGFLQALAKSFGEVSTQPPTPVEDFPADAAATGGSADGGKMPGTRYSLAAAYSVVQGDTRMSFAFKVENGPVGPAPVATWA